MKGNKFNICVKFILLLILVLILSLLSAKEVSASTSATYFYEEPIILENKENIEILSNEIKIDTTSSKIQNIFLLKNTSDKEIKTKVSIKLEDEKLSTTITDLNIEVNNLKLTHIEENDGVFSFLIKIPAGEGKKIDINYKTENDLKNAKVIKYTLEKLKGQTVKLLKFNVILPEEDVPLVTGIYPYCYDFENNTVSVNYYDFKVNSLTSDFIIEKETYKNLLYGNEQELSEEEEFIIKNAKKWINEGVDLELKEGKNRYEKYEYIGIKDDKGNIIKRTYENKDTVFDSIMYYAKIKQLNKENKLNNDTLINRERGGLLEYGYIPYDIDVMVDYKYPLTVEYTESKMQEYFPAYGKRACIDYIESEQGKDLYVTKSVLGTYYEGEGNPDDYYKDIILPEIEILKIKPRRVWMYRPSGVRTMFIGTMIDGSIIEATEEEKMEYINMINADVYIRLAIYDGKVNKEYGNYMDYIALGYYDQKDLEMIQKYAIRRKDDDLTAKIIVDFQNQYVAENSQIPTLAQSIGYRELKDGKYKVNFFENFGDSENIGNVNELLKTSRAQELINSNRSKNTEIKNNVETEISNLIINNDTEEVYEEKNIINDIIDTENNKILDLLKNKDVLVIGGISVLILICLVFIVIQLIKNKTNDKNINIRKE